MDKDQSSVMREGTRHHSKLTTLIVAASSDQVDVLQKTKFLVEGD